MFDDDTLTEEELDALIGSDWKVGDFDFDLPDEPDEEELEKINGSIDSNSHNVTREE